VAPIDKSFRIIEGVPEGGEQRWGNHKEMAKKSLLLPEKREDPGGVFGGESN